MTLHEHAFRAMGTEIRLLLGDLAFAPDIEAFVRAFEATLTRFSDHSELSRLNADQRAAVPASPLLRRAVRVALDAARATGGLVDPTLLTALERASATAVAPSAAHAEALAKAAFLAGPARARRLLREHGGVLVHDDGGVEELTPIAVAA